MAAGRRPVSFIVAIVVGAALILTVRSLVSGGEKTPKAAGPCVTLEVAASSEKAALLGQIADAYARTNPNVNGRCARVHVFSKSSGGAAIALARGWDVTVDGSRPDVWSPASSSWVVILRQRLAARDAPNIVPDSFSSVAQTPLVIAMPRPMATVLGWPKKAVGWSDILGLARDPKGWGRFGHPEWGAFRLGKTNPNFSTSGLNATIAAYFAATGRSSDLTETDVASPKVVGFIKGVESSVVHYGDITLTFLGNLQKADDAGAGLSYISAVTVEEKSVWDYNKGNPSGNPSTLGKHAPPRTPLVAIYPKEGTLVSDNPFVVLAAPWVDNVKRQIASAFLAYLHRSQQQERFQKAAFRDYQGKAGDEIVPGNGLLPKQPSTVISPPAPKVLDAIQRSWGSLRKRARVLLVIDVSGSMGAAVPKSGSTKLELAKRAATTALGQFARDDNVGLWIFSDQFDGGPYKELLPVGPLGPRLKEFRDRISSLTPMQGTALYATLRAAEERMVREFDRSRINAIVLLTDGKNEYPADTDLDGLLQLLGSGGESSAVRVFPIAYGEDADLPTLTKMAEASRGAVYNSSDPASIDAVFTAVVSNF
jgi:Ca-activated chloride channel homolog